MQDLRQWPNVQFRIFKTKLKRIDCAFTLVQKIGNKGWNLGYRHFFRSRLELKHILLFGTIIFIQADELKI